MTILHAIPELPSTPPTTEPVADLNGIPKSLRAMHHLIEMYRRHLSDEKSRRRTARLANRLLKITTEFRQFIHTKK